ncbi:unnamed protein product [Sphagnum jensenii]
MLDEVRLLLVLGVKSLVLLPSCTCGQLSTILLAKNRYDIDWQYGHATWYGRSLWRRLRRRRLWVYRPGDHALWLQDCGWKFSSFHEWSRLRTGAVAFDLSGSAINSLAVPGQEWAMRNIGTYSIQYMRVPCEYGGQNVAFAVDAGSSPYGLSFAVKYEGGPGDIPSVMIRQSGSYEWEPMQHNWGASWMLIDYSGQPFKGPFDVQIIAKLNGHSLIAWNAIPDYFQPGATYNSTV